MKIKNIETLVCSAGWRPWAFIKISTSDGIVGYSECTESFGSIRGVLGVVEDLKHLLIGRDPRATERLFWDMYRITRQSPGGVVQKAIGGIENALLDIKAKALGIPVYELFGGPLRDSIRVYWSHCGTTRARSWKHVNKQPINSLDDIAELGNEVVNSGFTALKTNIIVPGNPPSVLMQGYKGGSGSTDQNLDRKVIEDIVALIGTFRDSVGNDVDICIDLNFNFKTEGNIVVAKALEPFDLLWLELESYDPHALLQIKETTKMPICSGENLSTSRDYRPFLELHAMDIAAIDVLWNGFAQSKKIADMAEVYEINVAPHNHYSHLATFISAHFCAAIPNVKIFEVDVDDVPWKDELVTKPAVIKNGYLNIPEGPGWGTELNEDVIKRHPWSF